MKPAHGSEPPDYKSHQDVLFQRPAEYSSSRQGQRNAGGNEAFPPDEQYARGSRSTNGGSCRERHNLCPTTVQPGTSRPGL